MNEAPSTNSDTPVLTLIQQIKAKQISPATLPAEDRRRCVEVLRGEGYGLAEIAQILQRNEKTIRRDLETIRAQYALSPDPNLAERLIGQLVKEAETSVAYLRKIAREQGASAMERCMSESFAWKVMKELFEKLQSVGYLPRVAPTVVAEVYSHITADPVAGYESLAQEVEELARISKETGQLNDENTKRFVSLLDEVNRGRLSVQIEKVKHVLETKPEETN